MSDNDTDGKEVVERKGKMYGAGAVLGGGIGAAVGYGIGDLQTGIWIGGMIGVGLALLYDALN